jgi:hypothetical protein
MFNLFTRRSFLYTSRFLVLGLNFRLRDFIFSPPDQTYLLSENGCGRATGYAEANKIVTANGKTYFSWLDTVDAKFEVYIRSLEHNSGTLSEAIKVGEAHDNHGGPALTLDSRGYLHIVYFPHHHPMHYRRSKHPHDISEWEDVQQFGERCTYPTLICGPDDTLYCSVRFSSEKNPWQVKLFTKRPQEGWMPAQTLLESRYPGYSHFQESLAWSPVDQKLHLFCRFHEGTDGEAYGKLQTLAYMQSDDFGATWQKINGEIIDLPAQVESLDVIERGGEDYGILLRAGGMTVDRRGVPYLIYSEQKDLTGNTYLVKLNEDQSWHYLKLNSFLPKHFANWILTMPGGVTIGANNEIYIVAQIGKWRASEKYWGHPTNEVVLFYSEDGGENFEFKLISDLNPESAHWLPNIERNSGFHPVKSRPYCIYTAGPPGLGNQDLMNNKVLAVQL